jgi:hypothetical protein
MVPAGAVDNAVAHRCGDLQVLRMITIPFSTEFPGCDAIRRELEDALLDRFSLYIGQPITDDTLAALAAEARDVLQASGLAPELSTVMASAAVLAAQDYLDPVGCWPSWPYDHDPLQHAGVERPAVAAVSAAPAALLGSNP